MSEPFSIWGVLLLVPAASGIILKRCGESSYFYWSPAGSHGDAIGNMSAEPAIL